MAVLGSCCRLESTGVLFPLLLTLRAGEGDAANFFVVFFFLIHFQQLRCFCVGCRKCDRNSRYYGHSSPVGRRRKRIEGIFLFCIFQFKLYHEREGEKKEVVVKINFKLGSTSSSYLKERRKRERETLTRLRSSLNESSFGFFLLLLIFSAAATLTRVPIVCSSQALHHHRTPVRTSLPQKKLNSGGRDALITSYPKFAGDFNKWNPRK